MHSYNEEEINYLREISFGRSSREITDMFNNKFGLSIGEKTISSTRKRYGITTGRTGQFKKGQDTWNKGVKGYMGANETSFKKGNVPPNRVPVGTERLSKDNYIEVKIQDGKLNKNWKFKHVLIWEKQNGSLPQGHVVLFGDGNKENLDINNLICISRKQLVILNKNNLIQSDVELTKIGINIADVKLKIGERKRK